MITTRFRDVVWTGGICAAALSFYLVSQTVAAKRAELALVERRIAATDLEIRSLHTEIATRGGVNQVEGWNMQVYGLKPPSAEQFVSSSLRLVALAQPRPSAPALQLDPAIVASHGAVRQVNLDLIEDGAMSGKAPTSAAAAPQPIAQPALRQANYVQAKPSAMAPASPSPVHEAALRKSAKPASLGDDFLVDLSDEGSATRSRKVKQ